MQDEAKNSLTEIQTLEKNTNQEVDKLFKSEALSSSKNNSYKLLAPEESIELFNITYLLNTVSSTTALLIIMEALISL